MAAVDMSAMSGKLEAEVELKAPPAKFYNIFRKTAHHVPTHAPSNIQDVKVHEGDWDCHDTIKIWNYTCEGKQEVFKEKVEFDDANKTAKLVGVDGDVMKIYKVYNVIYHLVPKADDPDRGVCKLTIEYEKLNPDVPPPTKYMDFVVSLTKNLDAGLANSA
ncbi:MLP-like protein 328 [Linum grandiflorum]